MDLAAGESKYIHGLKTLKSYAGGIIYFKDRDRNGQNSIGFQEISGDAVRYWEKLLIPYNLLLAVVVVAWLVLTWPHFRTALNINSFLWLAILGILANICYSAAYLVDVPMQYSSLRTAWRRGRRWVWLMGNGVGNCHNELSVCQPMKEAAPNNTYFLKKFIAAGDFLRLPMTLSTMFSR